MKRATPASHAAVSFPTLVDFGCMLRLVSDWICEDSPEATVRSVANVLHALDTALRLERLGPICAAPGHAPHTLLAQLEHAAMEVLGSQAVKDAATVDEILAVTKRRVEVLQQMLDSTPNPPAHSFDQLRDRSVFFIDLLLAQGSMLPPSAAGVIAKAVLEQLRAGRLDAPTIDDTDAARERVTKKIAPLIESATGRSKKLKRDGAADIFAVAMRALGLAIPGAIRSAAVGSGSAKCPAPTPGRPRGRRPPRGR
jgi:hypothetical protein